MKITFTIYLLMASLCALCFWAGKKLQQRDMSVYHIGGMAITFDKQFPNYGIPLMQYTVILQNMRDGLTNEAIQRTELFLDDAVYDAEQRRRLLSGNNLKKLDDILVAVARYRKKYPRHIDSGPQSYPELNKINKAQAAYYVDMQKRQIEIDDFLNSLITTNADKELPKKGA